jgi:hypothetical protein
MGVALSLSSKFLVYHPSEGTIMAMGNNAQGKDKKKGKAAPKKNAKTTPKTTAILKKKA